MGWDWEGRGGQCDEVAGWLGLAVWMRVLVMSAVSKYKLFLANNFSSSEKQEIFCWRKSAG